MDIVLVVFVLGLSAYLTVLIKLGWGYYFTKLPAMDFHATHRIIRFQSHETASDWLNNGLTRFEYYRAFKAHRKAVRQEWERRGLK